MYPIDLLVKMWVPRNENVGYKKLAMPVGFQQLGKIF